MKPIEDMTLPAPPTVFVRWIHRDECLPTTAYENESGFVRGLIGGQPWDFTSEMVKGNPLITHWAISYFPIYKR
jgi:hypothetical protein